MEKREMQKMESGRKERHSFLPRSKVLMGNSEKVGEIYILAYWRCIRRLNLHAGRMKKRTFVCRGAGKKVRKSPYKRRLLLFSEQQTNQASVQAKPPPPASEERESQEVEASTLDA